MMYNHLRQSRWNKAEGHIHAAKARETIMILKKNIQQCTHLEDPSMNILWWLIRQCGDVEVASSRCFLEKRIIVCGDNFPNIESSKKCVLKGKEIPRANLRDFPLSVGKIDIREFRSLN
jgi:hypothetical protein